MGQTASRSDNAPTEPPSRRRRDRLSSFFPSTSTRQDDSRPISRLSDPPELPTVQRRRASWMDLSRFREDFPTTTGLSRQPSSRFRMHRPRFSPSLSTISRHMSTRRRTRRPFSSQDDHDQSRAETSTPFALTDPGYRLPDVDVPRLEFDMDNFSDEADPGGRSSSRRSALPRPTSSFSERFSSLRPDRGIRNMTSSLRRRRSPLSRDEDQAAMLSRLLSVAAAATAATLMNGDQRAVSEARSISGDGEDGTFESFLRALQNGRIASALRQSGSENLDEPDADGNPAAPLNFFRMFRFGSSAANANNETGAAVNRSGSIVSEGGDMANNGEDGRMVPIIIVGIRSISPGSQDQDNMPPFLDALQSFPSSLTSPSDVTIDGLLRQPQHGTRITHRRRASMGGLGTSLANYDSQRHHRSPDRPRPLSTTSDTPSGPRPPPSTPASAGLSAFSSGATTPTNPDNMSSPPHVDMSSRRSSFAPRAAMSGLETPVEEPSTLQRPPRQRRRLSESDFSRFGSGSSRRNGVVAPDAPTDANEGSRSWIIYVLGGSYPENHPILTTPSLFTDSPTYEDMLLLSALLGPAKPPVASEADVASAPGLLVIRGTRGSLVAMPKDGGDGEQILESVALMATERCQVCLCEYEAGEEARKLVKCGHLFHRECIDQVKSPVPFPPARACMSVSCCGGLLTRICYSGSRLVVTLAHSAEVKEWTRRTFRRMWRRHRDLQRPRYYQHRCRTLLKARLLSERSVPFGLTVLACRQGLELGTSSLLFLASSNILSLESL